MILLTPGSATTKYDVRDVSFSRIGHEMLFRNFPRCRSEHNSLAVIFAEPDDRTCAVGAYSGVTLPTALGSLLLTYLRSPPITRVAVFLSTVLLKRRWYAG